MKHQKNNISFVFKCLEIMHQKNTIFFEFKCLEIMKRKFFSTKIDSFKLVLAIIVIFLNYFDEEIFFFGKISSYDNEKFGRFGFEIVISHRKIHFGFTLNLPKSDCFYHFLIDLTPNRIPFGSKSIGKWLIQSDIILFTMIKIYYE